MKKLEITTIVGCSNMCSYCPQELLIKAYTDKKKKMSFEDFKKIMANVPKNVGIDFSGFSEAFLNKESSLMMKYSIENGYNTVLYTTLTGFTENDVEVLKGLYFDSVVFHQYDGKSFNSEKFNVKRTLFESSIRSKQKFGLAFIESPDKSKKGLTLWSRGGNLFEMTPVKGPVFCSSAPEDFNHNLVMPNGDVYICCMDYGLKHKLGNLNETNYNNLDRTIITQLSNKSMSDLLCRTCELCKQRYEILIGGMPHKF